jgi:hypothetical protein
VPIDSPLAAQLLAPRYLAPSPSMSCVQGVRSRVVAAAPAARAEEAAAPAAFRAPKAKAAFAGVAPTLARGARAVTHAVAERESRAADPRYAAFAAALDKYDFNFRVGDKVSGTVIMVENNGIYVDIGAKGAAFCPAAECAMGKAAKARAAAHAPRRAGPPAAAACTHTLTLFSQKPDAGAAARAAPGRRFPTWRPSAPRWSSSSPRMTATRRTRSCCCRCAG